MNKIIVTSDSPEVEEVLKKLNVSYEVGEVIFTEDFSQKLPPANLVKTFSFWKAKDASGKNPDSVVIGSASFIYFDERPIRWPKSKEELKQILLELRGKSFSVYTGFTVIDNSPEKTESKAQETKIHLRDYTEIEIESVMVSPGWKDTLARLFFPKDAVDSYRRLLTGTLNEFGKPPAAKENNLIFSTSNSGGTTNKSDVNINLYLKGQLQKLREEEQKVGQKVDKLTKTETEKYIEHRDIVKEHDTESEKRIEHKETEKDHDIYLKRKESLSEEKRKSESKSKSEGADKKYKERERDHEGALSRTSDFIDQFSGENLIFLFLFTLIAGIVAFIFIFRQLGLIH